VLPEPWLPLKKGQTLVNGLRTGGMRVSSDANRGVVLSLRTRYGILRGKTRAPRLARSATDSILTDMGVLESQTGVPPPEGGPSNPWVDAHARVGRGSHSQSNLSHRLSFDPGSGVIALPEDSTWMVEDEDSEDDYGSMSPTPEIAPSPNNVSQDNLSTSRSPSTPLASPSKRRHSTYYHHPERRRQTIPGDFPFPTSS
jgi:hypothetical protein